jgi:magnesium-transporting ATPase (P-type)
LLRASERELLHKGPIGDGLVNAAICIGSVGLGDPPGAAVRSCIFGAADMAGLVSRERARRLLDAAFAPPRPARVPPGGTDLRVPVGTLGPADVVLLATAEPVPADGRIGVGSGVDRQRHTGESVPRAMGPG